MTTAVRFDGAELARAIVAHPDDAQAALGEYEDVMFARSAAFAREAHEVLDLCLGDRAPYGLIELITGGAGPQLRWSATT